MPETVERRRNRAPWVAFLLVLCAIALNMGMFFGMPGDRIIPLLSLLLGLAALALSAIGAKRAFGQPQVYGGKVSSSIFAFLAIAICALMTFGWIQSRALPPGSGAPQVGQKAPDFTLTDAQGNKVSLAQLLGPGDATAPKAVLLVFYRGYW
jgi:hypothetical protein